MKKIFTDEQEKFMIENYLTMSYKEIGKKLGFTERQIRGRLNNMGYTKVRKINDHYFVKPGCCSPVHVSPASG